jgi:hypothetical protein
MCPAPANDLKFRREKSRRTPGSGTLRTAASQARAGARTNGSRVERSRCLATQRDDALDAPDPLSAAHPPAGHKRVTTLARLLGPRWPQLWPCRHGFLAGWGIPHAWIAGRPWQEGPPRDRGGPRWKGSWPPRRPRAGNGARVRAAPHHGRGRGRHGDGPGRASFRTRRGTGIGVGSDRGFRALTRWPAALAVMPADRLMPSRAPPLPAGRRRPAAAPSSGPARRPRHGLRSGHPAQPGRHRGRRAG